MPTVINRAGERQPDRRPVIRRWDGSVSLETTERQALAHPYAVMATGYGLVARYSTRSQAQRAVLRSIGDERWEAYVPYPLHVTDNGTGFPAVLLDIPDVRPELAPEELPCRCGCELPVSAPGQRHEQEDDFGDADGFDVAELAQLASA